MSVTMEMEMSLLQGEFPRLMSGNLSLKMCGRNFMNSKLKQK